MKNLVVFVILIVLLTSCISSSTQSLSESVTKWDEAKQEQYLRDRQDSTTWYLELFQDDVISLSEDDKSNLPINWGAYPVPDYKLPYKDFRGMGNHGALTETNKKSIGDKTILYNSFFVRRNKFNEAYIEEKEDEVFFHIIVLTDYIDTLSFSNAGSLVSSRDNPHLIGEGFFATKNNKIDYVSFITADRDMYAIVNMRLFNLKYGKTILISPQKDGSLRSMQIESPILSSKDIDTYTDKLLEEKQIRDFFLAKGNI